MNAPFGRPATPEEEALVNRIRTGKALPVKLVSLRSPVAIQDAGVIILGVTAVRGEVTDWEFGASIAVRGAWSPDKCLWAKGDEDAPITLYVPAENIAGAQELK